MKKKIVIGTRGSRLALLQANSVADLIKSIKPDIEIEIKKVKTQGDLNRKTLLERWGQIGVFVKEIEQVLLAGEIDLAVHSLKDMPTDIPKGLCLAAVSERLDPGDALVAKAKLQMLLPGSRIGTGSLRRNIQLRKKRPDLEISGIRGNIETRLKKIDTGEVDGVIVAVAALKRLGWEHKITSYLNTEDFLPAPGQGAIAVEARRSNRGMVEIASAINNNKAWQSTSAERSFLSALGGGCHAPIAALGTFSRGRLHLEGMVGDMQTGEMLRASAEGSPENCIELGEKLARKMIDMGADKIIERAETA